MNYKYACKILNIDSSDELTTDILKKNYRSMALKYHPDKNFEQDAVSRFQEIQEAYEYLIKYKDFIDIDDNSEEDYDSEDILNKNNYKSILFSFLKNILIPDNRNKLFLTIFNKISTTCESNAIDILNKLDKQVLIKIYEIIDNYREVLHFSEDFLLKIKDIVNDKIKDDECIILNPTIDDLFENNLYKLKLNGFTYIVPLWHNELYFDIKGTDNGDIIVLCNPE